MRKFTISIVPFSIALFTLISPSHAMDICEMKRSQQEQAQCYQYAIKGGQLRMDKNYKRIGDSSNVSQREKQRINTEHDQWADNTNKRCRDNACVYESLSRRNSEIGKFMRTHGLTPM